jgi:hypothetical protein
LLIGQIEAAPVEVPTASEVAMRAKPKFVHDKWGKLRPAVIAFAIVFGSALLVQGAQNVIRTSMAESAPEEQTKSQLAFAKFKRPTAPPVPEGEILLNLAGESMRGGLD